MYVWLESESENKLSHINNDLEVLSAFTLNFIFISSDGNSSTF